MIGIVDIMERGISSPFALKSERASEGRVSESPSLQIFGRWRICTNVDRLFFDVPQEGRKELERKLKEAHGTSQDAFARLKEITESSRVAAEQSERERINSNRSASDLRLQVKISVKRFNEVTVRHVEFSCTK